MKNINKIIQAIKSNKTFLLSTHMNIDPDALCSELAFADYLRSLGKKVFIVNDQEVPERYDFLPHSRQVKPYKEGMTLAYDVAIVFDAGVLRRIGQVYHLIDKNRPLINIDHHITNTGFGSINYVNPGASSTTEVLFDFFTKVDYPLTKKRALWLYVGIMTDTGSFRYDNTSSHTHRIVAELLRFQLPVDQLYSRFYEMMAVKDVQFLAKIINRIEIVLEQQVVCLELTKRIMAGFSNSFDFKEAILKSLRTIKGARVFIIFSEADKNKTRVNLRSAGTVDVARLAAHFGGGGHRRASGCTIEKNIKDAHRDVLSYLKKVL